MFLFPAGLALNAETLEPEPNVTGVVTSTTTGATLPTYGTDEADTTERSVVTNARGYYSAFRSTESRVLLSFGDVALTLLSLEAMDAASAASALAESAELARLAAQDAAGAAAQSASAATAVVTQLDATVQSKIDAATFTATQVEGLPQLVTDTVAATPVPAAQVEGLDTAVADVIATNGVPAANVSGLADVVTTQTAPLAGEVDALQVETAGLRTDVNTALASKGFVVVDAKGDPIPAGSAGKLVLYRNATVVEPPPAPTYYRYLNLSGIPDGTPLSTATLGPGGTPLDAVSTPSPTVEVDPTDGPRVYIPTGTTAYTWRWTVNVALGVFTFDLPIEPLATPTKANTILVIGGVLSVSLNTSNGITILNSAGAAAPSSVGGSAGAASPAMTANIGEYHLKGTRASTAAGTLTKFRLYDPSGAQVWSTDGVNRDVGVATGTTIIMGRAGDAGGEYAIGDVRVHNVGTELA